MMIVTLTNALSAQEVTQGRNVESKVTNPVAVISKSKETATIRIEGSRVTFEDGSWMELAGIGEPPQRGGRWWRPDGSPLKEPFDDRSGAGIRLGFNRVGPPDPSANVLYREIAVSHSRTKGAWRSFAPSFFEDYFDRGNYNGYIRATASFPSTIETINIVVQQSTGEWKRLATGNSKGESDNPKIRFEHLPVMEKEEDAVEVVAHHPPGKQQFDLVILDKSGNIVRPKQSSARHLIFCNPTEYHSEFEKVPLEEIIEIRLMVRSLRVIEFRNVSLNLGSKSAVEIAVDGKLMTTAQD